METFLGVGGTGNGESESEAFTMPISATPISHLTSQHAKTESTWENGNVTLLHFQNKVIFILT